MTLWQRLMTPQSIAVVGASATPEKTSGRPIGYLLQHGYRGKIFPVNPRADTIAGLRCYPHVAALPQTPDVALILLDAEQAQDAVRALAARGTAAAIVLASGYAETDAAGARRQQALREVAGTMRLLGPNTIGLINATDGVVLSASGALAAGPLARGSIALVSQSGGILGALLSRAHARGIGFSKLISTGNEADLDVADFVSMLADDANTRVIALYLEGLRHPAAFMRAARTAAAAGKRVVAFNVGRSASGVRAAASHTGALAGADRMVDALFAQTGILRAHAFMDLLDMSVALTLRARLRGKRVAVLTSTGGAGALVADSLGLAGFALPAPDATTARALQENTILARNPIDVTLAGLQPTLLRNILRCLLQSPSYDALVVIVGSSGVTQPELMANALHEVMNPDGKPVLAYISPHAPLAAQALGRHGIVALHEPESVAAALTALHATAHPADRFDAPDTSDRLDRVDSPTPPPAVPKTLPRGALDEAQAKALFAQFGIPVVRERIVHDARQAQAAAHALGPQVALKLLSTHIVHKTDVGGVALGLTVQSIATRLTRMRADVLAHTGQAPTAYLVQEMVDGVAEVILGIRKDALGTALLIGMGGVMAELLRDTALVWLTEDRPLQAESIRTALRSLRTWPLLDGYRAAPKADVDALVDAARAFGEMARSLGDHLVEAEINPLFVRPQGQGVVAADGVATLA